jgi:hypothetical protein
MMARVEGDQAPGSVAGSGAAQPLREVGVVPLLLARSRVGLFTTSTPANTSRPPLCERLAGPATEPPPAAASAPSDRDSTGPSASATRSAADAAAVCGLCTTSSWVLEMTKSPTTKLPELVRNSPTDCSMDEEAPSSASESVAPGPAALLPDEVWTPTPLDDVSQTPSVGAWPPLSMEGCAATPAEEALSRGEVAGRSTSLQPRPSVTLCSLCRQTYKWGQRRHTHTHTHTGDAHTHVPFLHVHVPQLGDELVDVVALFDVREEVVALARFDSQRVLSGHQRRFLLRKCNKKIRSLCVVCAVRAVCRVCRACRVYLGDGKDVREKDEHFDGVPAEVDLGVTHAHGASSVAQFHPKRTVEGWRVVCVCVCV